MKVLQINCVNNVGSTGKIMTEIHSGLQEKGMESVICYGRGERVFEPNVYKTCGELYSKMNHLWANMRGQMYGGCSVSTARLINIIKKEKPDVVHLQCINGYFVNIYRLISWLKDAKIKTVVTLHAEFMFTGNCSHARDCERWKTGCGQCPQLKSEIHSYGIDGTSASWKKMRKAFEGFGKNLVVVSVSPWLMSRAKQSPLLAAAEHCTIFNGLDTKVFHRREISALRAKYPADKKIIFFATTYLTNTQSDIKGGRYIIELAKQLLCEDVMIVVAGRYDSNLDIPSNMVMLGHLADQNMLANYYSMADVTVLTSLRETFSMVTAESLCCGTPVVGFEAGGPESIALSEYSQFVPQGNVHALKQAVISMLEHEHDQEKISDKAIERYSGQGMVKEYIETYRNLMEK